MRQSSKQQYKVLEKITEYKKPIEIYDPEPFRLKTTFGKTYCFPFDTSDQSPTAKQWSGRGYGRIEWIIEPRKFKWDKTEKRFYITQVLIWATQTRDKRYHNKIFGINCMTETIGGIAHKYREYEEGLINQAWRVGVSPITKTLIFDTYPNNNFNLLYIDATSSISLDAKFLRFDLLPTTHQHYKEIWKLHHQSKEYVD